MHRLRLIPGQLALLGVLAGLMAACTGTDTPDGEVQYQPGDASLSFPSPRAISESRVINQDEVSLDLTVRGNDDNNSVNVAMTWTGSVWTGSAILQPNQSYNLNASWRHNTNVELARLDMVFNVGNSDIALSVGGNDFFLPDSDNDGFTNVAEIEAGTDPGDSADVPDMGTTTDGDTTDGGATEGNTTDGNTTDGDENVPIDVIVPRISQAEAPVIDGLYDDIWNSSKFNEVNGVRLNIDNLMVDNGTVNPAGNSSPFTWSVMHDTENLYIMIFGEEVDTSNLHGDSIPKSWNDDSFEIFFDPDHSRTAPLDGVNDLSVIVGMLDGAGEANSSSSAQPVIIRGQASAFLAEAEFAACVCTNGQHTLEIAFSLSNLGIPLNEPFGIEIEVNDDIDGGDRDRKWGWKHPVRQNGVDTDFAFLDTRIYGTAVLSSE